MSSSDVENASKRFDDSNFYHFCFVWNFQKRRNKIAGLKTHLDSVDCFQKDWSGIFFFINVFINWNKK